MQTLASSVLRVPAGAHGMVLGLKNFPFHPPPLPPPTVPPPYYYKALQQQSQGHRSSTEVCPDIVDTNNGRKVQHSTVKMCVTVLLESIFDSEGERHRATNLHFTAPRLRRGIGVVFSPHINAFALCSRDLLYSAQVAR